MYKTASPQNIPNMCDKDTLTTSLILCPAAKKTAADTKATHALFIPMYA